MAVTQQGPSFEGRVFRVVRAEGACLLGSLPYGGRVFIAEGAALQKESAEAQLQVGCYTGYKSQVICTTVWGSCGLKRVGYPSRESRWMERAQHAVVWLCPAQEMEQTTCLPAALMAIWS
ncbi:hypothetical protein AOLI_G00284720 [Acnodon oligacanthus]